MSKISVGNVFWNLRADGTELPKDVKKAISRSKRQMEKTGSQFKSAGKKITAGVTAPILGIGIASLKMSADFDDSMREVNSLIGLPAKGFKDLKQEIRSTAKDLGLKLGDGAKAAYQAISAGIPQEELTGFLKVAGKSAVAGVSNLETSVGLLTKSMDAYGDKSVSVSELSDQLFATVKGGVTNFEELAGALPNATGLAAALGVESKELLGILARTTKVSDSTSGAVTRISSAMGAILKPSKDMSDLLEAAGIESAKAEIETNGLTSTLLKLRKAAKGNETVVAKAFGRKEAILLMSDLALNTDAWRVNIDAVSNSSGAMAAAFEEIDKGPGRAFAKMAAATSELSIQIGDILMPAILPVISTISSWVTTLGELDSGLLRVGVVIAGVAASLGPLLIGAGMLVSSFAGAIPIITGMTAGVGGLTGVFGVVATVLTGPVGLAIVGFIALGALVIANWDRVKAGITSVIQFISNEFTLWKNRNAETIASVVASFSSIIDSGQRIFAVLSSVIGEAIVAVDSFLAPIGGLSGAWEAYMSVFRKVWDVVGVTLGAAVDVVASVFSGIADVLDGSEDPWEAFKGVIKTQIEGVKKIVKSIFGDVITYLKTLPAKMISIGKDVMTGLAKGMTAAAMAPINAARNAVSSIKNAIKGVAGFDTGSPSKWAKKIGGFVMEGLGIGIRSDNSAVKAGAVAAARIKQAIQGGLAGVALGGSIATAAPVGTAGLAGQDNFSQDGFSSIASQYIPEEAKIAAKYQTERAAILNETRITEQQRTDLLRSSDAARNQALVGNKQDFLGQLAGMQGSHDAKMAGIGRAAAVAQAAIQKKGALYEAVMNTKAMAIGAYKALAPIPIVGPFLGIAAAAAATAYGASQIGGIKSQGAFAKGGDFVGGQSMLVGEEGPELVVPRSQGTVLTASETASLGKGGGGVSVIQNFYDATPERLREMASEIEERAKAGVIEAVTQEGPARDAFRF